MRTRVERVISTYHRLPSYGGFSWPGLRREEGQTLAEYALILALVAIVVVGAVLLVKGRILDLFTSVEDAF